MRLYQVYKGVKRMGLVWAVTPEQAQKYAADQYGTDGHAELVPQV